MKVKLVVLAIMVLASLGWGQGPAFPYSVALNFTASTGIVTGYNMYRAPYTTVCGTFAKLNASPFTGTSYTDNAPPQGFYCYAATAVNGTQESGLSSTLSNMSIPPPPPTGLGATVAGRQRITFQWAQSTGSGLIKNSLWSSTVHGGPYTRLWTSTAPAMSATLIMPHGTTYVVASAYSSSTIDSGASNEVIAIVP